MDHPKGKDEVIPMMAEEEYKYIDNFIQTEKPSQVLEWGSGDSTVYFTKKHDDIIDRWDAVEDDPDWHRHTRKHSTDIANCFHLDEKEYYAYFINNDCPSYDMIIVDGRYRRACMVVATQILDNEGTVFLHDAGRSHYSSVYGLFDNYETVTNAQQNEFEEVKLHYNGLARFWSDK